MASRYRYLQMMCDIPIVVFSVYNCDIWLSVGRYFIIDNRLSVLPFACRICSADFSISKITLYCRIL